MRQKCNSHDVWEMRTQLHLEKLKERDKLGDTVVDCRILLKIHF
jgi:hypothetical protein